MPVQHASIPDTLCHEPKNISSATNKQVYVANGSASGSWRKLNELDLDYTDKTKNIFGWNDIADSQYTSSSKRAITSGTRTKLTNNGLASQTDTSRLGPIWDTTNNRFTVNDLNALYIVKVQFKADTASTAGTPYIITLDLQTSNGNTIIAGNTQFVKGGSALNWVSFTTTVYMGSFINNTNLEVYVTPDTNMNIYDVGFIVQRAYKES